MIGEGRHPYAVGAPEGELPESAHELRQIESTDDIIAFAELRYRVWLKEGYVPAETLPGDAKLELDVADYYSRHFGMFDGAGRLLGGGRLIFEDPEGGRDWITLLNGIAEARPDPVLRRRLARSFFQLPSDLCNAFPEFLDEYKQMFDAGVRMAEVSRVVLTEELRGGSASGYMMMELIRQATAHDVDVLLLTCATRMEPFYTQFGFQRHHRVPPGYYGDIEIESIVMSQRLGV